MPTIIRATDQNRAAVGVAFNFDDMATQARQYLDKIRAEAAEIIAQAQRDAVVVRQRAEKEGQQAALASTEQMIQRQLGNVLPALKQAIQEIHQSRQAWLAHWETTGLHVAAALAARITRGELSRRPEIPMTLIREALQLAAGSPEVRLHLNPADHQALSEQAKIVMQEIAKLGDAKIISDANVTPGGCRVETRFGTIDQQFEAQLARIEEELGP
jgi:flagellar assembly protein FliH